jgi:hypothetical protein
MSKAILVIERPETCGDCPCIHVLRKYECWATDEKRELCIADIDDEKPTWCPLKDISSNKKDSSVVYNAEYDGYLKGWNDCLKEILGGAENG